MWTLWVHSCTNLNQSLLSSIITFVPTAIYMAGKPDALYVSYGRLDVRRSSIKIHGSDLWNTLPPYIHNSESSNVFKIRLRNYLIDRKVSTWCESSLTEVSWIFWSMIIFLNSNFFVRLNSKCLVENMKNWARCWLSFFKETGHYLNQLWPPKNFHTTWNAQWVEWNQHKWLCIYLPYWICNN